MRREMSVSGRQRAWPCSSSKTGVTAAVSSAFSIACKGKTLKFAHTNGLRYSSTSSVCVISVRAISYCDWSTEQQGTHKIKITVAIQCLSPIMVWCTS